MPSTEKIEFVVWTCSGCGRIDKQEKASEHDHPSSQHFTAQGHLDVSSVGRDYQGAVVGPGWTLHGDLCDACLLSLGNWALTRGGVHVAMEGTWKAGHPCGSCGSTRTYVDDDGNPACRACGRNDGDDA